MPDWKETLPEPLRADASLATIPDVPTLAQNYIETKKLVGQPRLPKPQDGWTDKEWNDLYDQLGRPKDVAKYAIPDDVKLEEGVTIDDDVLKQARETFHKHGLTEKQGRAILGFYANLVNGQQKSALSAREQAAHDGLEALKGEWKDKTDLKLDLARAAVREYGGEDLLKFLDDSGLGNNPSVVKAFANIGEKHLMEDSSAGRGTAGHRLPPESAAKAEIEQLKLDKDFRAALTNRENPQHQAALNRWEQLHRIASSGQE